MSARQRAVTHGDPEHSHSRARHRAVFFRLAGAAVADRPDTASARREKPAAGPRPSVINAPSFHLRGPHARSRMGEELLAKGDLTLWSARDVDGSSAAWADLPLAERGPITEVLGWSRAFLAQGHPELGRHGPVCPYTGPSLAGDLFFLSCPRLTGGIAEIAATVCSYREWFQEMAAGLDERRRQLLTFLVVLPEFDRDDSGPLDELQLRLKGEFVNSGLMIGQFHPACDQPGVWNEDFRPLRSSIPLLAIRHMVAFDLPFLVDGANHLAAYLALFAPGVPIRIRYQLADLVLATRRRTSGAVTAAEPQAARLREG